MAASDKPKHCSVTELKLGDYVKALDGTLHKIKEIWGVSAEGRLAKPSEGGFGCVTEDGLSISMWDAAAYHKATDVEQKDNNL
jgi:hypothetical protein